VVLPKLFLLFFGEENEIESIIREEKKYNTKKVKKKGLVQINVQDLTLSGFLY